MRVTNVRSTPLAIPLERPFHWSSGRQLGANLVLWTVETDEGVAGHGESICEEPTAIEAYGAIIAEWFLGRSPGDVEAILDELWREGRWRFTPHFTNQILSGLEGACWDVWGKAHGQPVSSYLGARVRDEIDLMAFPQGETAQDVAQHAAELARAGARVVYCKVGRPDASDEEIVSAVRDAIGPEPLLRVDANEAWGTNEAVERIEALEPYELDWVEQPVAADDVSGLAHVRSSVNTRIAADQAVFTVGELRSVLEKEAADVVVVGHHETGGVLRLRQLAALAEEHGVLVNRHACMESTLSTLTAAQAAACIPNLTIGNQAMHQLLTDPLVSAPAAVPSVGALRVADGPGLGIELDLDAVERARERYERQGAYRSVERS
ncbi:MAG TPA: mandelate racemase/muconate lactonizing enzyme family protein [Gaiellaceae bacterium]|nr:mandelate racemase/muconate lactonizing enzyme family protein [Gaiellaceae bacterium]